MGAVFNRFAWELLKKHYPKEVAEGPSLVRSDHGMLYALMDLFREELGSGYRDYVTRKLSCTVPNDVVYCACGLIASERVSHTKLNPSRLFLGCPRYRGRGTGCGFFQWGVG